MKKDNFATFSESLASGEGQSPTPFLDRYSRIDDDAWEQKLLRSLTEPEQDALAFPRFPAAALQERIHGNSGETALKETFGFYRTIRSYSRKLGADITYDMKLLDFGSGWGRGIRPFLARVDQKNLFAYEPNSLFCQVARILNPYVNFICGDYRPPSVFADDKFDLVVAWSVFTHLPIELGHAWLAELARVTRPGGLVFITAWGGRFIDTLIAEEEKLKAGQSVHWYYQSVMERAGDLHAMKARHQAGHSSHIGSGVTGNYGDTIVSTDIREALAVDILEPVAHDDAMLAQDLLVFRRK